MFCQRRATYHVLIYIELTLSTITSCYHATGDVTGTGDAIGGVLGAEGSPTSTGEFGVVNCCWSGTVSTDKGVGVTQAEIVVIVDKVDNLVTTWTGGAITTLNNPLTHAGWRYIENTGTDKETRPLVLEKNKLIPAQRTIRDKK